MALDTFTLDIAHEGGPAAGLINKAGGPGTDLSTHELDVAHEGGPAAWLEDVIPDTPIAGVAATALADVLAPTVAVQRSVSISGAVATATADVPAGMVLIGEVVIDGVVAAAMASALAAVVVLELAVDAQPAEATADVIPADRVNAPSISGARALATADALAADVETTNPTIGGAIATAQAAAIEANLPPDIYGVVAAATADLYEHGGWGDVPDEPLGTGGSPAGLNYGVCTIDFSIDGFLLNAQPYAIDRLAPQHDQHSGPRGYVVTSAKNGREYRFRWGEELVDIDTVIELRLRLGTQLRHTFAWTDPDGTAYSINGVVAEQEFGWTQITPGFYQPVELRVLERQAGAVG